MKSLDTLENALWPHQLAQNLTREQQVLYWKQQLTDLPGLLTLPTDYPRPARPTFDEGIYAFHLPSSLISDLKQLGQSEDTTLFVTLLTAFQIWLCRHSNHQEDILIGTPATEPTAGAYTVSAALFMPMLIIRTNLTGNPNFIKALQRVRDVTIQAYHCQDVPLEEIRETSHSEDAQDLSLPVHSLFQLTNTAGEGIQAPHFASEFNSAKIAATMCDLALTITNQETEETSGWEARFHYNTRLFTEGTISRFARRFLRLLEGIVAQPYEQIWHLPLLPDEEYELLTAANATNQEIAPDQQGKCIHQFFEDQVARTPEAPALVVRGETLSYAQLNRQANQLAHRLRLMGVGPEVLVGLCLPRTADLLIALLAILKAGGAYVPLDPAYPPDRLRFQIQDSGAHLLLTISSLEHLWQEIEVTRLYLDQTDDQIPSPDWYTNLECNVHEDNLAYVIYTSGSTGLPKGVCIAHRNTLALIHWGLRMFTLEDMRGMVAGTSICFDLSIFELFVPWSCGGTVYLVENGLHLPEGPAREQITLLNMVPSVMAELARTTTIPASVRVITFCGETLPRPLVERLYTLPGVQRIYNLYGPTEDTTYSTWSLLDRDEHGENVPIGQPLDNSQVYLLDQYKQQVPIGVIGEIYLGGAGVTHGYWNRPEMTNQRFLPDLFSKRPTARLYRTGDLARYRADGQLEFLGRIDQQVKIRGYRIELGEIESVLLQHTHIQECVVLARKPEADNLHAILVAYVVATSQHKQLEDELQAFLKHRLPDYMLPTFFVFLEALPKTSNGKIDRKTLPDPHVGRAPKQQRISQTKLTKILKLSAGKKELLKKKLQKESPSSVVLLPAEPEAKEELFPLAFSQQRYWIIDQLDPGTPAYNIFFASKIIGNLNVEALVRSIHEIVRRHETLRTAFFKVDGVPMQKICPPSNFPIPIIDLRPLSDEQRHLKVRHFLTQEPLRNFDVSQGIQVYASVLHLTETVYILLVTLHHISSDGWSVGIFKEELSALYDTFSQGLPSPLANLPIRYADYVLWQRRRSQAPLWEKQLSYWREQLANLSGPLLLPTDRPRPTRQTFNGKIYHLSLPPALISRLQQVGQSEGATLFMTFFAVYQILLCRLSGQEDVLVGTPIASRTKADFEKLVGCFVNTIVFRTNMQGNPTFRTLLQRVRTMALEAYSHQDIPFEQVLYDVRPERDTTFAYAPLFQVMFHYQNLSARTGRRLEFNAEALDEKNVVQPSGLIVEALDEKNAAAKFDLSLRINIRQDEEKPLLLAEFLYNTDLFDEATIIRFAQGLHNLLEAVIVQPDQRIWGLPFLSTESDTLAEHRMRQEWQVTTVADSYTHNSRLLASRTAPSTIESIDMQQQMSRNTGDGQAVTLLEKHQERAEVQRIDQSDIEMKLIQIWENLLQVNSVGADDDFFDLGGNSLVGILLMAKIQREFQQELPLSVLLQKTTPEQLAKELLRRRWSNDHATLVEIQATGSRLPFFAVHPIGGEVFCYADLARQLGSEQPFYGLQMSEQSYHQTQSIEEMASAYIAALQTVQPRGPYQLGGWSMGGVIAFEMAQQLLQQGQQIALLALFDSDVPTAKPAAIGALIQHFAEDLEGIFSQKPTLDYTQLQNLTPDEQLTQLYTCARLLDIIPPDLELEHLRNMFAIYQRNVEALRHYQLRDYTGPITLFLASSSEENERADRILSWQNLTRQEVAVHLLAGDHYSIMKKPTVEYLADHLQRHLATIG